MSNIDEIRRVMERAGCRRIRLSGADLVSTCPFHTAKSGLQFAMSVETGRYVCYSSRCGAAGTFAMFLQQALHYSAEDADALAEDVVSFEDITEEDLSSALLRVQGIEVEAEESDRPTPGAEGIYSALCPTYMLGRGFEKSVLRQWKVGFDEENDAVVFPVWNAGGVLIGFSRRPLVTVGGTKYLHPAAKSSVLYGRWAATPPSSVRTVYVGEGQADGIALDQMMAEFGIEGMGIATLGAKVSKVQLQQLAQFDRVVLAFDNPLSDEDGRFATMRVGNYLLEHSDCQVDVAYRFGERCKDPADMLKQPRSKRKLFMTETKAFMSFRLWVDCQLNLSV